MKADRFLDDLIENVDEKWIREAETDKISAIKRKRRARIWSRVSAAAACLGLVLLAAFLLPGDRRGAVGESASSEAETRPAGTAENPVIPKAQAADLLENYKARPVEEKEPDDAFIRAGYDWTVRLFQETYRQEKEQKTLLVSPLSAVIALTMTANGAKGNTLREMEEVLGGGSLALADLNAYLHTYLKSLPSSDRAKYSSANGIWFNDRGDFTVEGSFLQQNVDYFDTTVRKAPFTDETVREINQWVDLHTDGMIPEILETLDDSSRMVLLNALAFDAEWWEPYIEDENIQALFHNLNGEPVETAFMGGHEHWYLEDYTCIGFEKSYFGDTYRFVALLPKNDDFEAFIDSLTGEKVAALRSNITEEIIFAAMPKFSYDYTVELPDVLEALGMRDAFHASRADFSGISRSEPLYISQVLQKTHIDLDSAGTRASAVTAVMTNFGAVNNPREVILDRPFVYMIVDTAAGLPLFIGTVTGFSE